MFDCIMFKFPETIVSVFLVVQPRLWSYENGYDCFFVAIC